MFPVGLDHIREPDLLKLSFTNMIYRLSPGGCQQDGRAVRARLGFRAMSTLVLVRHGESEWNAKGLFTGWVDASLSERGPG